MKLVLLAVVLVGCTSFEPIESGVCGNGLIEPGEDCDSNEPSCSRCAVLCAAAADCPTSAYTCGADGMCHAPGGVLGAPVPAGPFQIDDLAVTDIDRDGIGDAVGVSSTSIAIRYGDPGARLSRAESVLTPSHSGPAAFGDLDGDGAIDIAMNAPDGLVAYGSRYGALAPLAVRSSLVDTVEDAEIDLRQVFQLSTFTLGAFAFDRQNSGIVALAVLDFLGNPVFAPPCAQRLGLISEAQFLADTVDVYKLSSTDAVVAFLVDTTPRALCVMALHKPLIGNWAITDITPSNAGSLTKKPVLADLDTDADKCPGLVNTDGGAPALRYWDGSMSGSACTLTQVASPLGQPLPALGQAANNVAVARAPVSPAFPSIAADLLVMSDGVYAYQPGAGGGFGKLYPSERRLAGADFADLDGDNAVDVVLRAETEDDIDVLFRRPNSFFPLFPGYVVYRVDTASRVVATKIGDYDGNGLLDLAIVEQLSDYQRMAVAFGRTDYLSQPVTVAAFESVLSMATIPFGGVEDQAAVTDDLIVLQPPPPGRTTSALTLMLGSPLGTLIPFFDPRLDEDPVGGGLSERDRTQLVAVISGQFGRAVQDGPGDLITIGVDARDVPSEVPAMWTLAGTDFGPDATEQPLRATSGLADCAAALGSGLCVRDARFLAWPTSGDDTVFAIDRAEPPHAVRLDPQTGVATSLDVVAAALADTRPRSLARGDVDGDGAGELIVVAAAASAGPGVVLACTTVDAEVTACVDHVPAIVAAADSLGAPVSACVDATTLRASYHDRATEVSLAEDLVVACRDAGGSALYRVHGAEVTLLARTATKIDRIHAGDVTGDGVPDVLAIEGERGAQSLVVFPQCSSRDALTCAQGGS